ncbi:MAG: efflux RND transporter permease subunit [candidate division Zixibacteria bacterium]|nr:efflux RND transporter permease subunit [candidate division Zixibacteria bacterium]
MNSFFRFFTERHMLANLFTVMMILLGVGALVQIKRDIFPEVDFGEVIITTRYPGASPEDVELNVTNRIEEEIKGVSNIDNITSYSMEDLSIINISIDLQADDKDAIRDDIREAVNRVTDLPDEVTEAPLVLEINSEILPVIEVGVSGDLPYPELREVARLFKKKLENVSGVSTVDEFWYLDREIKIEVSPDSVKKYQIPLQEIAAAISRRNIRSTGGSFESYTSEKSLVTLAQFRDPDEVSDVIVRSTFSGPSVRVGDLATISDEFEDPIVISRMNGKPAITFSVLKKKSADIIRTADAIKNLVKQEAELLPDGVKILFADDISYYLRNRFNVVLSNGAIGLVLVLIVLSIFLNLRTAFWVALGIPVVLLGIIFLLPVTGAYLDIIALAAMIQVIGIIVDDGIIVGENIVRRRERGDPPLVAASEGIREVFRPVMTTILTTFLAFAPMFFMSGVFGEFVVSIPLVISLAVFISAFELVIALPAHLMPGLKRIQPGNKKGGRHWFDGIRRLFQKYMYYVLKARYAFLALSIALFFGTMYYTATHMKFVLFPSTASDNFNIYLELPVGSSMQKTVDKTREIEQFILELPQQEIASFSSRIGTHGERQPGEYEHWALIKVNLVPYARRDRTAAQIIESLRPRTDSLGGFEKLLYNVEAGGPPVGSPVTIRVVGSDDRMRRTLTDSLVTFLESIDGVTDIDRNDKLGKMQIQLDIDYDRLARLGLTVADVAATARIAYDGQVVTSVRYGEEDVDFRVIFNRSARTNPATLGNLLIPNDQGRLIRLSEVATFNSGPGPSSYYHYDRERTTTVTGDIVKGKATPLEVTSAAVAHFDLDRDWPGMRMVIGGEAEETAESFRSLFIAFIIAVIGIYFILILLFNSATQPLMVMVAIPFGLIAVVIAFALHGEPLGFLAMMGLIGLTGVVVNDSLVMVDHINQLRKAHPTMPILDVVAQGAANRLRAIIMTTLTTVVGLIPLAYGIGGSDPFIAPMALALGYGLLFATPLTLILVPCLYTIRTDIFRLFRWIFRRTEATAE